MKRPSFIIFLVLITALLIWYGQRTEQQPNIASAPPQTNLGTATVLRPAKPLVEFSLTDTQNKPFTAHSFQGHWTLLFFGYAQCPEICPRTLAIVSELWRSIPELKTRSDAQFVFVSLDPKSDSSSDLQTFLGRFHPDFIGLTGDEQEVVKLAKACRVHSWTDPVKNAAGQKVIDHSAAILLINPEGKLEALFSPPHVSTNLARELKGIINR